MPNPTPLRAKLMLWYLLTPWSTVLLEKLTGSAASQETPRIFGTRRFITVLTSARHLSHIMSQLHPVLTTPSHFLKIHLNIILPSASGPPQWSLSLIYNLKSSEEEEELGLVAKTISFGHQITNNIPVSQATLNFTRSMEAVGITKMLVTAWPE